MILVRTNLIPRGFDAFTCWPFIFIRPASANDQALIEHERVHLAEQARWLVLPWFAAYVLSRRFRQAAEIRGYRRQIELGGISVDQAAELLVRYRTGVTRETARQLLAGPPQPSNLH